MNNDIIYINKQGQVVSENYPNATKYIKVSDNITDTIDSIMKMWLDQDKDNRACILRLFEKINHNTIVMTPYNAGGTIVFDKGISAMLHCKDDLIGFAYNKALNEKIEALQKEIEQIQ